MTRTRRPVNKGAEKPLPHESERQQRQPYAREDEQYSGAGVVKPPEEKVGKRDGQNPPRKP